MKPINCKLTLKVWEPSDSVITINTTESLFPIIVQYKHIQPFLVSQYGCVNKPNTVIIKTPKGKTNKNNLLIKQLAYFGLRHCSRIVIYIGEKLAYDATGKNEAYIYYESEANHGEYVDNTDLLNMCSRFNHEGYLDVVDMLKEVLPKIEYDDVSEGVLALEHFLKQNKAYSVIIKSFNNTYGPFKIFGLRYDEIVKKSLKKAEELQINVTGLDIVLLEYED